MHGLDATRRWAYQPGPQASADAVEISPAARNIARFIVLRPAVRHLSVSGRAHRMRPECACHGPRVARRGPSYRYQLSAHDPLYNLFHLHRDQSIAAQYRAARAGAFEVWAKVIHGKAVAYSRADFPAAIDRARQGTLEERIELLLSLKQKTVCCFRIDRLQVLREVELSDGHPDPLQVQAQAF